MSSTPSELRYAASHEWVRIEDAVATVGISDFAQEALGDVVFVELPEVGQEAEAGGEIGVVESVKAAADIYSPIAGTVVEVNAALEEAPELVNEDPYGKGWFFRLRPLDAAADAGGLLDADAYDAQCQEESGD